MQNSKTARGAGIPAGMWCLALAIVAGCGSSGGGSATISSQPLSGKIGGQPWTLATAETNSFNSSATQYSVDAYSESFTPCSGTASTTADILTLNFPMAVGTYAVTLNLNQTFYIPPSDNLIATSGTIVISEVTATTITGGANFAYNADNSVDGQFQATICP